jgi:methionyl-tRNA formyltransferase
MRAVFLGSPPEAVPSLEALLEVADVPMVITQPDRPRGRSGTPVPPEVKVAAREHGVEVVQPTDHHELLAALQDAAHDVALLTAYGRLIRPEALGVPAHGFVNVHFSLLPRWRGASPVVRAILAGDDTTGVTLMQMDEGLDTGPTIAVRGTVIDER